MTRTQLYIAKALWAAKSLLTPWLANKALREENDRLIETISNPLLTGIKMGNGTLDIGAQGAGPQLLAGMFVGMFEKYPDAKNYIEVSFGSPIGTILVTVHRPGGKSPHTLLEDAKRELARLRSDSNLQSTGTTS